MSVVVPARDMTKPEIRASLRELNTREIRLINQLSSFGNTELDVLNIRGNLRVIYQLQDQLKGLLK